MSAATPARPWWIVALVFASIIFVSVSCFSCAGLWFLVGGGDYEEVQNTKRGLYDVGQNRVRYRETAPDEDVRRWMLATGLVAVVIATAAIVAVCVAMVVRRPREVVPFVPKPPPVGKLEPPKRR